jgi:hypothetical protein
MAITFDPRPTIIGNLMLVTGTFADGDTSIDFSGHLASLVYGDVIVVGGNDNPTEEANPVAIGANGTTLHFSEGASLGGRFIGLGFRN